MTDNNEILVFCDEFPWIPIRPNVELPHWIVMHSENCGCSSKNRYEPINNTTKTVVVQKIEPRTSGHGPHKREQKIATLLDEKGKMHKVTVFSSHPSKKPFLEYENVLPNSDWVREGMTLLMHNSWGGVYLEPVPE